MADPVHTEEIISLGWLGNTLVSPQKWWRRLLGEKAWTFMVELLPHDPDTDKWQKMNGWMDIPVISLKNTDNNI